MDKTKLDTGHLNVMNEKYNFFTKTKVGTYEVFYYEDIMFDREGNTFPFGKLSETAINFVKDGYLKPFKKDLDILVQEFIKLKSKDELKLEDFNVLDMIFKITNIYLKNLEVFDLVFGYELLPSDIFKVYDNKSNTYEGTITNIEYLIDSRIDIANDLYFFGNNKHSFSQYLTEELRENSKLTNAELISNLSVNRLMEELDRDIYLDDFRAVLDLNIKFGLMKHPNTHEEVMVKSISTNNLIDLLTYDYYRAFYKSQYVRICQQCNRSFLQIKNYQTLYCDRIIPGMDGKTCRDVGPKEKVKHSPIHRESIKAKDRIRKRNERGDLSTEEYLEQTELINELKDRALSGQLDINEFIKTISNV